MSDPEDREDCPYPAMSDREDRSEDSNSASCTNVQETKSPAINPITLSQLQLPVYRSQFTTFIDHGCIIDEQGYPTFPNGYTVFVLEPKDRVANFRFIGWTHTMRTETSTNKQWIIRRYYCLGVINCSNPVCALAASPPTSKKILDQIA